MEEDRVRRLNEHEPDPDASYVLYWMQQSQRAALNHALEYAAQQANGHGQGLLVGFGLTDTYPEANERHFAFMLEGLAEIKDALQDRGVKFVARRGAPDDVALGLAVNASLVVCDRGYLRHQREWRDRVARERRKRVIQVEGDVVVPVETASEKAEFAARTTRPKLQKRWSKYLGDLRPVKLRVSSLSQSVKGDVDVGRWEALLRDLDIDRSVGRVRRFRGGNAEARRHLRRCLRAGLSGNARL